jgi:hypothetical protein
MSSYPSSKGTEFDWHVLAVLDEPKDRELRAARNAGSSPPVYFVGQTWTQRAEGFYGGTTALTIVDQAGAEQTAAPNADIDLLNRGPYKLLTREPDRP